MTPSFVPNPVFNHVSDTFYLFPLIPMSAQQPRSSARQTLVQAEEQYNKRIDDDVAKLVDCFSDIVRVGEVGSCKTFTW